MQGIEQVSPFLGLLPYFRLAIPFWIIFYCFRINNKLAVNVLSNNWDVILLGVSWMTSSILSLDAVSYLLYGIWTFSSIISILFCIAFSSVISGSRSGLLFTTLEVVWAGNFIIVILDVITILFVKPHNGMYQLVFSSNTFWAYPTMILGILAIIKMKFTTSSLTRKIYLLSIFLVCTVAVYFSARRSPLFALILTTTLLFIPPKAPHIILILIVFAFPFMMFKSGTGEKIIRSLPDSYMKYRIERMSGLIKGRKETSYAERQKIWKIYLNSFYEKPVFGQGLAAVQRITSPNNNRPEGISAHNTFIGLLAETGLAGTILLSIVLGRSFYFVMISSGANWKKIYLMLLLPTLIINWVEYNLIPGQIFFLYTLIIWLLPRGLIYSSR